MTDPERAEPVLSPFPREGLQADAITAARALLGAHLVSTVGGARCVGRIVETEAYFGPDDPASHAAARTGRTQRNAPMFGPPGTVYVYRIYGLHRCLNVVTDVEGLPSAVLIRALEPLEGLDSMLARRGREPLAKGPGRLAEALGIDVDLNGHDLACAPLVLARGEPTPDNRIRVTGRVGVRRAAGWPLRFVVRDSPWVSRGPHQPATPDATYRRIVRELRD